MKKPVVLYAVPAGDSLYEIVRQAASERFDVLTLISRDRQELISKVKGADFVITVNMDSETMASASQLKLIQLAGVGFDGVDLRTATTHGIPVAQTIAGTIVGVAEHTLLLILALYKQLLEADASVRQGDWIVWQLRHRSYTLFGKTVGILGLGRIGREVAARCRAFGAHVIYSDVMRAPREVEDQLAARFLPREELLGIADIVTLHLPLLPATQRFFGEDAFRCMKSTALFINTARGGLVDEPALVRALQEEWIAGAGLDVLAAEPPEPASPLFRLRNTVLTPHIATGTRDSLIEKTRAACENFERILKGQRPLDVLNPEVFKEPRENAG